MQYRLIDHGIESSQYLIPHGTAFTPYENSVLGVGDTFADAIEDALENIAQLDAWAAVELDELIKADYKAELALESPSAYAEACKAYAKEEGCTIEEAEEADFESYLGYYVEILY